MFAKRLIRALSLHQFRVRTLERHIFTQDEFLAGLQCRATSETN